jgi:SAM-dependent methyltransferase
VRLARIARDHVPPETPWTQEYVDRHRAFLSEVISDPVAYQSIGRRRGEIPEGYGVGLDERVVEYPWLMARRPKGSVLDAGSTLNHAHILDRVLPRLDRLTIVTLAPEAQSFPERGVTYLYADLRGLPLPAASFDTIVSVSTLEHVGMDNRRYGASGQAPADPDVALAAATAELRRVLRPGGRLLLTVPFGRREDHGWFRQFDLADLERLIGMLGPGRADVRIYRYRHTGWGRARASEAADDRYRDFTADPSPVPDGAVAARAVACVALQTAGGEERSAPA